MAFDGQPLILPTEDRDNEPYGRTLDRSGKLHQSNGVLAIQRKGSRIGVYFRDLFHSALHLSTGKIWLLVISMYFTGFLVFTIPYYLAIDHCHTDWTSWVGAFQASVQIMMTIGLGATDPYFDDCPSMAILVASQSVLGSLFDAIAIGIIYDRLSRPMTRASSVIFSNQALIRKVEGLLSFEFRVVEARKHQLVESHVRLYTIKHELDKDGNIKRHFRCVYTRTHDPDDEIGGMVLLMLPQHVLHVLDAPPSEESVFKHQSPLLPPESYLAAAARSRTGAGAGAGVGGDMDMASDRSTASRSASRASEPLSDEVLTTVGPYPVTWDTLRRYWRDAELEVLVCLEGIDAATSDTLCARHSYTLSDVKFGHEFVDCVSRGSKGQACVDYDLLHESRLRR